MSKLSLEPTTYGVTRGHSFDWNKPPIQCRVAGMPPGEAAEIAQFIVEKKNANKWSIFRRSGDQPGEWSQRSYKTAEEALSVLENQGDLLPH